MGQQRAPAKDDKKKAPANDHEQKAPAENDGIVLAADLELAEKLFEDVKPALGKGYSVDLLEFFRDASFPANRPQDRTRERLREKFGWNNDDTVNKNVSRLQKALAKAYKLQPREYELRIDPASSRRQYTDSWRVRVWMRKSSLTFLFWKVHFEAREQLCLASNAPLFFLDKDRTYRKRIMAVNSREKADAVPDLKHNHDACFHFISLGDFCLTHALTRFFERRGCLTYSEVVPSDKNMNNDIWVSSGPDWSKVSNLISIGNRRVSWLARDLEDRFEPNFYVKDDDSKTILNRTPNQNESGAFEDSLSPGGSIFAVLVRRVSENRTDTLINAQNGPALQALADALIDEDFIDSVLKATKWQRNEIPKDFELLFKITVGRHEKPDQDKKPELIHWRVINERKPAPFVAAEPREPERARGHPAPARRTQRAPRSDV
jgi:hypothetical protein